MVEGARSGHINLTHQNTKLGAMFCKNNKTAHTIYMHNDLSVLPDDIVDLVLFKRVIEPSDGVSQIIALNSPFYDTYSACNRLVAAGNLDEDTLLTQFRAMTSYIRERGYDNEHPCAELIGSFIICIKSRIREHAALSQSILLNIDLVPDTRQCAARIENLQLNSIEPSYFLSAGKKHVGRAIIANALKEAKSLTINGYRSELIKILSLCGLQTVKQVSESSRNSIRQHPSYYFRIFKSAFGEEATSEILPFFKIIRKATTPGATFEDIKAGIIWCLNNESICQEEWIRSVNPFQKVAALNDWSSERLLDYHAKPESSVESVIEDLHKLIDAINTLKESEPGLLYLISTKTDYVAEFIGIAISVLNETFTLAASTKENAALSDLLKQFPEDFYETVKIICAMSSKNNSLPSGLR